MKKIKFCIICLYCIFAFEKVHGQFSVKTDLSAGVNYTTSYRKHMSNPSIDKTLPAHSYSAAVNFEYSFPDSACSIGLGFGLLNRPAIFILIDQDLSTYSEECDLSSMTFGYDSFYKKQNYCFMDFPIYFKRNYSNGLNLIAGLTFKYYCKGFFKTDRIFERLIFKDFNWSPVLGIGYDFNKNLSLILKTEPEYSPFIKSPDTDYKVVFGNFNTMLCIGYRFKI